MKKRTKRYIYEVVAVVLGLLLITWIVSLITPYTAPKSYSFIDNSAQKETPIYRAVVISKGGSSFEVRLQDGSNTGTVRTIPIENWTKKTPPEPGMQVLLVENDSQGMAFYDQYRLPLLLMMIVTFILVVLLVGRRKGLMSLVGLGAGIIVIGRGTWNRTTIAGSGDRYTNLCDSLQVISWAFMHDYISTKPVD